MKLLVATLNMLVLCLRLVFSDQKSVIGGLKTRHEYKASSFFFFFVHSMLYCELIKQQNRFRQIDANKHQCQG